MDEEKEGLRLSRRVGSQVVLSRGPVDGHDGRVGAVGDASGGVTVGYALYFFHSRSTNRDERLLAHRAGHIARFWPLSGLPCPFLALPFPSCASLFPFFSSFAREFSSLRPRLRLPRVSTFATHRNSLPFCFFFATRVYTRPSCSLYPIR